MASGSQRNEFGFDPYKAKHIHIDCVKSLSRHIEQVSDCLSQIVLEIGDLLVTVIFLRGGTPASLLKDPRALHRRASPRTESPWWGSMVRCVSIVEHGTVGSRSVPDFIVDIRAPRCIDMSRRCIDSCGDERVGTIIRQ